MYTEELHMNYQKSIQAFMSSYPYINAELVRQIDSYSRSCALCMWDSLSVELPVCTKNANEVYASDGYYCDLSEKQVQEMLDDLRSQQYVIPVPKFFQQIAEQDSKDATDFSRRLASCFKLMMIAFALIDNSIQQAEVKIIAEIYSKLILICDACHVKAYDDNINIYDLVEEDSPVQDPQPSIHISAPPQIQSQSVAVTTKQPDKATTSDNGRAPLESLNHLIGLTTVKKEISEITDLAAIQQKRKEVGLPVSNISYHLVFTGNPGTGKTTVARLVAQIYKELGILSKGHLIEASAKDLIAGYVGQTAIKTGELLAKAYGGVLFIDEAYTLVDKNGQGYGQEAIDTLLKEMEDHRDDLVVIVAGYDEPMEQFIESNPGLKSRFNRFIHFEDYTANEMYEIFCKLCAQNEYSVEEAAGVIIQNYLSIISQDHDSDFANARTVRNVFETIIAKQASRIASKPRKTKAVLSTITEEDVSWCLQSKEQEEESLESLLASINDLVGLKGVKEELSDLMFMVQHQQKRKAQGLAVPTLSLHLVFTGNPGTGKTTVARIVAKIYKALGILSKGHLVETDRSGLVAGYIGQTAIKTQEVINRAMGGVLFIDEAYTLSEGGSNDFGQEAIDTLLKAMEDNREDLIVIAAGYDQQMERFVHSNPGLESRFHQYIHFEDYTAAEMCQIFKLMCRKNQYELSEDGTAALEQFFSTVPISEIGNGRGARNLFERAITQQAKRIAQTAIDSEQELSIINAVDIANAAKKGGF